MRPTRRPRNVTPGLADVGADRVVLDRPAGGLDGLLDPGPEALQCVRPLGAGPTALEVRLECGRQHL